MRVSWPHQRRVASEIKRLYIGDGNLTQRKMEELFYTDATSRIARRGSSTGRSRGDAASALAGSYSTAGRDSPYVDAASKLVSAGPPAYTLLLQVRPRCRVSTPFTSRTSRHMLPHASQERPAPRTGSQNRSKQPMKTNSPNTAVERNGSGLSRRVLRSALAQPAPARRSRSPFVR